MRILTRSTLLTYALYFQKYVYNIGSAYVVAFYNNNSYLRIRISILEFASMQILTRSTLLTTLTRAVFGVSQKADRS